MHCVIMSSRAGTDKPHRQFFQAALGFFRLAQVLHVGADQVADVQCDLEPGLRVLGILRPEINLRAVWGVV